MNKCSYKQVVVISARRSAISNVPGAFNQMQEVDLLSTVFGEVSKDLHKWIDSAILGSAFPIERDNLCRKAVLASGIGSHVDCTTISKTCASSDEALAMAYMQILSGKSQAVLVGGCEKVSNSPYILGFMKKRVKEAEKLQLPLLNDVKKLVNENDMHYIAEILAHEHNISRKAQDSYAIKSRLNAIDAYKSHRFDKEIIPICYSKDNEEQLCADELIQQIFKEDEIRSEKPMFVKDGMLTRYNTAPMCDCAVAMVIMDSEIARSASLKYLVEIADVSWIGVRKEDIGYAMKLCVKKILANNHLSEEEIDLYEINESFAAQAIIIMKELGINHNKVNVNGGNLALGYPIGASGLRMCITLIYEMLRSKARYGISTMCGGGAMANAVLFKNSN